MKKSLGLGLDCIISGDSEEAKEIFRKLGRYDESENKKIEECNEALSNKVLWLLATLLIAWFSYIFIDEPTKDFALWTFAWFGIIKQVFYSTKV